MLQTEAQKQYTVSDAIRDVFTVKRALFVLAITTVITWFVIAQSAYAQSDTIEIDMAPFFGIFAIVGGIMAAMALSRLIINAVVGALSGRGSF